MVYDAIIIGGGPAGLMAAVELEKKQLNYLLLEKNEQVGKKLLISGNKRCNITNNQDVETFINALTIKNKKFLYSALYTFGPDQVIDFFEKYGCPLQLENNFKYFPKSNKAQSVLDVLLNKIGPSKIRRNQTVVEVVKEHDFVVVTKTDEYYTKNVIVATGSKSFPSTGSNGFGLQVAKTFGVKTYDFIPAETHIYTDDLKLERERTQGVSFKDVILTIVDSKQTHQADLLITHFGLSGPVIYHLSEFIYESVTQGNKLISLNLVGKQSDEVLHELKSNSSEKLKTYLKQYFTKRFTDVVLEKLMISKLTLGELSKEERSSLVSYLTDLRVNVSSVQLREKAYVNKGGIDTLALSPNTMEVKNEKGLYFVGETVNIHGPIGGYNITMAFATGKLAAMDIVDKYMEEKK